MSDRPSGHPNFATSARGLPVVAAPAEEPSVPEPLGTPAPSVVDSQATETSTGWSPTAWRVRREGGA